MTAGPWRADGNGHLIRELSDGRLQRGDGEIVDQCQHCTVPTPAGQSVCGFCADYTPPATPAQRLDVAVNKVDLVRHDVNEVLSALPADAPLMAVVDVVTALNHLKRAAVALDRATDALEADAAAVTR
ncbi:hypothetical protein L2K20_06040 [Mycobacterium sp. MBM]|nr:hypothetical protein [Mycobacterium sp. MBM]